jgi:hypothetical protein
MPRQVEIAEWAIDPMHDFFVEQFESGEMLYMPEMPFIRKDSDHLEVPEDEEVIGDLLYRLLNLFQDICNDAQRGIVPDYMIVDGIAIKNTVAIQKHREQIKKAKGDATSARQLARKIKTAAKYHHIKPVEYVG